MSFLGFITFDAGRAPFSITIGRLPGAHERGVRSPAMQLTSNKSTSQPSAESVSSQWESTRKARENAQVPVWLESVHETLCALADCEEDMHDAGDDAEESPYGEHEVMKLLKRTEKQRELVTPKFIAHMAELSNARPWRLYRAAWWPSFRQAALEWKDDGAWRSLVRGALEEMECLGPALSADTPSDDGHPQRLPPTPTSQEGSSVSGTIPDEVHSSAPARLSKWRAHRTTSTSEDTPVTTSVSAPAASLKRKRAQESDESAPRPKTARTPAARTMPVRTSARTSAHSAPATDDNNAQTSLAAAAGTSSSSKPLVRTAAAISARMATARMGKTWPTGSKSAYCHQCRNKSNRLYMQCEGCTKLYCCRCLETRYESLPADMFPFVGGTRKTCPCCENWCTCDNCCRRRGVAYVGVLRPLGLSGVSKETEGGRTSARGRAGNKRSKQHSERHSSRQRRSTSLSSLSDADEDGRDGDTEEEEEKDGDGQDGEPTGDTQEDEDEDAPGPMDIDETIVEGSSSGNDAEPTESNNEVPPISADGDAQPTPGNDERSSSALDFRTGPASADNEVEHRQEGDEQQAPVDEEPQEGYLLTPEPGDIGTGRTDGCGTQSTSAEPTTTTDENPSEGPDGTLDFMELTEHPPSPPMTTTALFVDSTPTSDTTPPPHKVNTGPSEPAQVTRRHQKIGEGPSLSQRGLRSKPLSLADSVSGSAASAEAEAEGRGDELAGLA